MIGYLQNIPKNQSFTLMFSIHNSDELNTTVSSVKISKDSGAFAVTTNSATLVTSTGDGQGTSGTYSLVLTATEMNASRIVVQAEDNTLPFGQTHIIIYTTISTPISTDHLVDAEEKTPAGDLTVTQVLGLLAKRLKRGNYKI